MTGLWLLLALAVGVAQVACAQSPQVGPGQVTVKTATELVSVLRSAGPGRTILLAPGNYGTVKVDGIRIEGQTRIASADLNNRAVIQYLSINRSKGLAFSAIEFAVRPGSLGVGVVDSSDIQLEQLDIHGVVDGDPKTDPTGVSLQRSANVTISRSRFHDLGGGIGHSDVNGLTVVDSRFEVLRSDGITGTRASNVTISRNYFTDFYPEAADHPDAVQLWVSNGVPTRNVTIVDNTFERGRGRKIQGIFLKGDRGVGFEDVMIRGNAMIGCMYHGISVTIANRLTVSDNLVLGYEDMVSWIQINDGKAIRVTGNTATSFIVKDYPLRKEGNTIVKTVAIGDDRPVRRWREAARLSPRP